jgi:CobQ-like glutamine amidotransferase family enzyme
LSLGLLRLFGKNARQLRKFLLRRAIDRGRPGRAVCGGAEVVDRCLQADQAHVLGLDLGGVLQRADAAVGELDRLGADQRP